MPESIDYSQQHSDPLAKLRSIEESQRILKDRVILIGKNYIEEREKNFKEIQELKKTIIQLKEDNKRIKEILKRITEQINNTARKEELAILQRQFDLFRK
jgi:uncharacterized membrane protein